jgi:hypothetical protein
MPGSMWRREETRPVGPTQPCGPGASRRPYPKRPSEGIGARSWTAEAQSRIGAFVDRRSAVAPLAPVPGARPLTHASRTLDRRRATRGDALRAQAPRRALHRVDRQRRRVVRAQRGKRGAQPIGLV